MDLETDDRFEIPVACAKIRLGRLAPGPRHPAQRESASQGVIASRN